MERKFDLKYIYIFILLILIIHNNISGRFQARVEWSTVQSSEILILFLLLLLYNVGTRFEFVERTTNEKSRKFSVFLFFCYFGYC